MATEKRLIDANYLVNKMIPNCSIEEGGIPLRDFNQHQKILALYPTVDAVEVVLCKDCKHRGSNLCPMETVELYPWFGTKNDAFCSYGERKEDDV